VRATAAPLLAVARSVSGRLSVAAQAIVAAGDGHAALLRLLDTAPATGQPVPETTSVRDADSALRAARTWLWQHPSHVVADHLRAGTQLGLAVAILNTDQPAVHYWKRAATAIAGVHGSAPRADGYQTATTLVDLLRWTRDELRPRHGTPPAPQHHPGGVPLAGHLPLLAAALHNGAVKAVERGDLFLARPELRKPGRAPIFYATPV
jgi:hypothetical protein